MDDASAVPPVTQAKFARMRGVSRKTVTVWKKKNLIRMTSDGRVDVRQSIDALDERAAGKGRRTRSPAAAVVDENANALARYCEILAFVFDVVASFPKMEIEQSAEIAGALHRAAEMLGAPSADVANRLRGAAQGVESGAIEIDLRVH
jgi:hypothetical protein